MPETTSYIDQYLNGELSDNERKIFEQRLKDEPQFAADFKLQRALSQSLALQFSTEQEEAALRKTLQSTSPQFFKEKQSRKIVPMRFVYAAMAIAAILLLFLWQPWQKSLFEQYYASPQLALNSRGATGDCNTQQIEQLYNSKKYVEALPAIEKCLTLTPNDAELILSKAISLLETNRLEEARENLGELTDNQSFKSDAIWYTALSFLKEGQTKKAKELLLQLPEGNDYETRAKELINKL